MIHPGLTMLLQAGQPARGGGGMMIFVVQMAAIVAIFYFLLIRPQRQQQKKLHERLGQLKKGDEVISAGGVVGQVVHLADDRITVKSGEARLVLDRGRIAQVIDETGEGSGS